MSGVAQYQKTGPHTYTPGDGFTIRGGRLVEAIPTGGAGLTGRIREAQAGSVITLGFALTDAMAPEDLVTTPVADASGRPVTAMYSLPTTVAVADGGIHVKATYAADATFGQALIAAANGTVTPAGATPDARTIVGWCREPAGVVVATNPRGLTKSA